MDRYCVIPKPREVKVRTTPYMPKRNQTTVNQFCFDTLGAPPKCSPYIKAEYLALVLTSLGIGLRFIDDWF
jgi:hypothetical protein